MDLFSGLPRKWLSLKRIGVEESSMKLGLFTWRAFALVPTLAFSGALNLAAAPKEVSLLDATKAGELDVIRALLRNGVDVNSIQADGTTALHWAVQRNDLAAVQLLLHGGANARTANR